MMLRVEFYGIVRHDAGVDHCWLDLPEGEITLGDVTARLGERFAGLTQTCLAGGRLSEHCVASLDGQRFLRDPQTMLRPGEVLLLLSADAGG